MNILVFGNEDIKEDSAAILAADKLRGKIPGVNFISVDINRDISVGANNKIIIMDTVMGINDIKLFSGGDIDKIKYLGSTSVHDYDLGFQLKYLSKLGKINLDDVIVIGLPMNRKINYLRIQSILKKLVAQDMQGS